MKLIRAYIDEFAGIKGKSFDFGESVNIIEGDNESGKSSLFAFIRFMLYGFSGRLGTAELSDKEKYTSWSGRRAAGQLTVEVSGKLLRIERDGVITSGVKGDTYSERPVQIVDVSTGAVVYKNICPGELFLGVNAQVFASSCCIPQMSITNISTQDLGASIENMLRAADESINVARVEKKLEDTRREYIHKTGRGGKLDELNTEKENLTVKLIQAEESSVNLIKLDGESKRFKRELENADSSRKALEAVWAKNEARRVLEEFDRLSELKNDYKSAYEEHKKFRSDAFPNGVVPRSADAERLSALSGKLSECESRLNNSSFEQQKYQSTVPYDESLAAVAEKMNDSQTGEEAVISKYDRLNSEIVKIKIGAYLSALFAVLLLGGSVVINSKTGSFAEAVMAALIGVALGAVSALLFVSCKHKSAKYDDFLAYFDINGTPDRSDFISYISSCFKAFSAKNEYASSLNMLKNSVASHKMTLDTLKETARAEFEKLGTEFAGDSVSDYCVKLNDTAFAIVKFAAEDSAACERLKAKYDEITKLSERLSAYNENELREKAVLLSSDEIMSSDEYEKRKEECSFRIREAYRHITETEKQIATIKASCESPCVLKSRLDLLDANIADLSFRAEALKTAIEAVETASSQLRQSFTPTIRREAGCMLSRLTSGTYNSIGVSDDFSLSVEAGGATRDVSYLSGGTRDAAYLSLRLALTVMLCHDGEAPMMFDESFSQLDDTRTYGILGMLKSFSETGHQCLIFTCHSREARMMPDCTHILLKKD